MQLRATVLAGLAAASLLLAACSPPATSGDRASGDGDNGSAVTVEAAAPEAAPSSPDSPTIQSQEQPSGTLAGAADAIPGLWAAQALACNSGEAIRFTATEFGTEDEGGTWQLAGNTLTLRSEGGEADGAMDSGMDGGPGSEPVETNLTLVEVSADRLVWRDFAGQEQRFVRCQP